MSTPDGIEPAKVFPTADQIATAMVAAAKFFDEDPQLMALKQASRGRLVAMAALVEAFPEARKQGLSRAVGFPKPDLGFQLVRQARLAKSWEEARVDEIVGLLVADDLGEQAA